MERNNPMEDTNKDLIIKFLLGKANLIEEKELKRWIAESDENLKLFEDYRLVWLSTSVKSDKYAVNRETEWNKLNRSLSISEKQIFKDGKIIRNSFNWGYLIRVAAILIVVFLTGFLSSRIFFKQTIFTGIADCEIITPLGSKTFLNLPDGSQVWLNAGSKLKYSKSFNQKIRKVYLQGEAYFKVKSNKKRPFIVSTGKVDIQALGTTFNVKAYPEEKYITATLVEGVIKVDGMGDNKFTYTLKPKQNITILKKDNSSRISDNIAKSKDDKELRIIPLKQNILLNTKVNTEIYTSWKDSLWTIKGESLHSLAILFERRYNVKIHIESPELNNYKFSGTIRNETFEQVLQFLRYTTPIKYKVGKGETWWKLDPQLAVQYSKVLEKADQ